tara:strand:+ start:233 stop:568 length:336 start_codon:yes stop_codon:yes gene_type:complete
MKIYWTSENPYKNLVNQAKRILANKKITNNHKLKLFSFMLNKSFNKEWLHENPGFKYSELKSKNITNNPVYQYYLNIKDIVNNVTSTSGSKIKQLEIEQAYISDTHYDWVK